MLHHFNIIVRPVTQSIDRMTEPSPGPRPGPSARASRQQHEETPRPGVLCEALDGVSLEETDKPWPDDIPKVKCRFWTKRSAKESKSSVKEEDEVEPKYSASLSLSACWEPNKELCSQICQKYEASNFDFKGDAVIFHFPKYYQMKSEYFDFFTTPGNSRCPH